MGLALDNQARRMLGEHLGDDVNRLVGIARSLLSTHGPGTRLGVDEIAPFLGSAGDVPPWDLTDAIANGDIPTSLRTCRRMVHGGERHPLAILSSLTNHYARMASLDGAPVRGEKDAASYLGVRGSTYPVKKAMQQARRMGGAEREACLGAAGRGRPRPSRRHRGRSRAGARSPHRPPCPSLSSPHCSFLAMLSTASDFSVLVSVVVSGVRIARSLAMLSTASDFSVLVSVVVSGVRLFSLSVSTGGEGNCRFRDVHLAGKAQMPGREDRALAASALDPDRSSSRDQFAELTALVRRDFFREAALRWITPLLAALSMCLMARRRSSDPTRCQHSRAPSWCRYAYANARPCLPGHAFRSDDCA